LQAYDALQTAAALRRPGRYEQNGTLRPFTRGGAAGIAFGFALGDLLRERALRAAPESVRNSANALQALGNIDGIITTRRALHGP
jgi:hypothetical protein